MTLRSLCASLCEGIYPLIANIYELFMNICQARIMTSRDINGIYERIVVILSVIMTFYITFELIKYLVEPDDLFDKSKGVQNIFFKAIIVVILLAFIPKIFGLAYRIQGSVFEHNLFSKIILGKDTIRMEDIDSSTNENSSVNDVFKYMGRQFSATTLSMFYKVAEGREKQTCGELNCNIVVTMNLNDLAVNGKIYHLTMGINSEFGNDSSSKTPNIEFNWFLAPVVGLFMAWILAMYCIDVGTRTVQLAYLQIIAPIPIIGYLSPKKDGIFQAWVKQCITTYLDLFIRTSIIYLILELTRILTENYKNKTIVVGYAEMDGTMQSLVYAAIIVGLLVFAKRAPKMIEELLPKGLGSAAAKGTFGLNPNDRTPIISRAAGLATGAAVGAAVGVATGIRQGIRAKNALNKKGNKKGAGAGIAGATWGAIRGTVGGTIRGAANGAKKGNIIKNATMGAKNQIKSNTQYGNRAENGYTLGHQIKDIASNTFGGKSRIEKEEEIQAPLKRHLDANKAYGDSVSKMREHAFKKAVEDGKSSYAGKYKQLDGRINQLQNESEAIKEFEATYRSQHGARVTQTDLDTARAQKIKDLSAERKKAKDLAINDYIDNNKNTDGNLVTYISEMESTVKNYNEYSSEQEKMPETVYTYTDQKGDLKVSLTAPPTGATNVSKKDISTLKAEELDEFNKQILNVSNRELTSQISESKAREEQIKRETSGSGIAGDKK